jgi:hypothetical protein
MDKVSEVLNLIWARGFNQEVRPRAVIEARHSLLTLLIERLEEERKPVSRLYKRTMKDVYHDEAVQSCINAVKGMFGEGER